MGDEYDPGDVRVHDSNHVDDNLAVAVDECHDGTARFCVDDVRATLPLR
jgi:hypothetical protein